jgi:hypothetical protein
VNLDYPKGQNLANSHVRLLDLQENLSEQIGIGSFALQD